MVTPESSAGRSHSAADEVGAVVLDVRCIKPYERNPRHSENPEYDRIKASIRASGIDQPLVITQRPGSSDYIVHSGGNTRLLVLKDLYEETGDDRFSRVQCLFKPWNRESDVLLAHLRENDLRGGLTFIDKALAIFDIKRLFEEELDIGPLSQRRLQAALREGGYSVSDTLISRMGYAVEVLLPLIPQALNAGLGRPQVQKIRALDRAARRIWEQRGLGDEEEFNQVFATLCQRYDDPDWDTDLLRSAIETEIAEQADISVHTIRMELDAHIEGRELSIPEFDDDNFEESEDDEKDWLAGSEQNLKPMNNDTDSSEPDSFDIKTALPVEKQEEQPDILSDPELAPSIKSHLDDGQSDPGDIKSLRARAWTLAARLAQRNGISDLVEPLSGRGLGFVLRDVPDPALADQLDDDSLSQVSMVWWQLAACAEMTVAPVEAIAATLPGESVLRQALEQQDAGLLFNSVWTLDPGHTGYRLWRQLGEQDWNDLLNLMSTYRQIHHLAESSGIRLWG
ncbi:MAG: ParB N-terminal domain-containing protein [Candidatus Thiodiazotropha sp. (ex Lucinoma borealis)]|nr:ParB N-terminal domain-containing protein [Candidatus Thiodiazotropha sp. (ex Lucinoma borealis)]